MAYLRALPEPPKVVAIDTLHRFYNGSENDPAETSGMINACNAISAEFGSAVIFVHHTGVSEEAQKRARGSGSWKGASSLEYSVRPEGAQLIIEQLKNKDHEEQPPRFAKLDKIDVHGWVDEDGDQITTVVVDYQEKESGQKADEKIERYKTEYKEAWEHSGKECHEGKPIVSSSALREYIKESRGCANSAAANQVKPANKNGMVYKLLASGMINATVTGYMAINADFAEEMLIYK
jgi:hypothetical protein